MSTNTPDGMSPDEETLDISGTNQRNESTATYSDVNRMEHHSVDLHGISSPGESTEDFLDKLLQVPHDQLIPWEQCCLPSKGLYYDGDWGDGLIYVRAMGQQAEKILATSRLAKSGQSIDYLFRECCRFPEGFDPINLLLGDRVFLLYFLRGITHGNIYEFALTCPNQECQAVSTHVYDLNELSSTIKWANPSLGEEPFRIVLPYLTEISKRSVWVSVRFLRSYDSNDILARRKVKDKIVKSGNVARTRNIRKGVDSIAQRRQTQQLDDTLSENLERVIVNIMGSDDPLKIRNFVSKMHAKDTATVREWLKDNTPGIDSSIIVTCPECNNEFTVELPITESFFRPAKPGGA